MCRLSDTLYGCGCAYPATAARRRGVLGKCSPTTLPDWRGRVGRPRGGCARYILRPLMIDRMTIAAVARELGLSWDTVNTIAMDATQMIVAADTHRLDGVRVIGVDEHRWSHTRHREGFVTVIIDLTPVLAGTRRARLLDMVPGRSAAALTTWLAGQTPQFRAQVEVVAMDGFGGYKTAATDQLPEATTVMDPFYAEVRIMPMSGGLRLVTAVTAPVRSA
jgi:transposase